jgi:hypothetical protein
LNSSLLVVGGVVGVGSGVGVDSEAGVDSGAGAPVVVDVSLIVLLLGVSAPDEGLLSEPELPHPARATAIASTKAMIAK